jgi:hypothetical protein
MAKFRIIDEDLTKAHHEGHASPPLPSRNRHAVGPGSPNTSGHNQPEVGKTIYAAPGNTRKSTPVKPSPNKTKGGAE